MKLEINEYYGVSLELITPANSTHPEAELGVLTLSFDPTTGRLFVDWNNGDDSIHFDAFPRELSLDVTAKSTIEFYDTVSIDVSFDSFDEYQSYRNDPDEYLMANHDDEIIGLLMESTPDDTELDINDICES